MGKSQETSGKQASDVMALVEAYLDQLRGWQRSGYRQGDVDALREGLLTLPANLGKMATPEHRAVARVRSAFARGAHERLLLRDPQVRWIGAPFIEDATLSPPRGFLDPQRMSDDDAVAWAPSLAWAPATDRVRHFLDVLFGVRRRMVWVPISRAIAALACRDDVVRGRLREWWTLVYGDGISWSPDAKSSSARLKAYEQSLLRKYAGKVSHARRHVLHAVCAYAAHGGDTSDFQGFSAKNVADARAQDAADASAQILALTELLEGATRAEVPQLLVRVAERLPVDPQIGDALRIAADALDGLHVAEQVEQLVAILERRHWMKRAPASELADRMWTWVESVEWHAKRDEAFEPETLLETAPEMTETLGFRSVGKAKLDEDQAVDAAASRLARLTNGAWYETSTPRCRARVVVELLALLRRPEISLLDWGQLVRRSASGDYTARLSGYVKDVAEQELVLLLAESEHSVPAVLIRDQFVPFERILDLVSARRALNPSGQTRDPVATHLGVQLERVLRAAESGESRVRTLWELLKSDPSARVYEELFDMLRGESSLLHDAVEAAAAAHKTRHEPLEELLPNVRRLCEHCKGLVDDEPRGKPASTSRALDAMSSLIDCLERISDLGAENAQVHRLAVGGEWRAKVRSILIGIDGEGGVKNWMGWLGGPNDVEERWQAVEDLLVEQESSTPGPSLAELDELGRLHTQLKQSLAPLAWPDGTVVGHVLGAVNEHLANRREDAMRTQALGRDVTEAIARSDENAAASIARSELIHLLSSDDVRKLHSFLLRHLLLAEATRMASRVGGRVQVPSVVAYLAPLYAGLASGALGVFGAGDLSEIRDPSRLAVVSSVCFLLSFVLLAGDLSSRMAALGSTAERLVRTVARVLPVYISASAFAGVLSLFGLWATAQPIQGSKLLLWTGLTLFLGLFLGLLLQGKSAAASD